MKLTASNITAAGNAIGFNASGQTIVASKKKKQGLLTVKIWLDINGTTQLVRNFGDVKSALAYVDTILDQAKTKELAWW